MSHIYHSENSKGYYQFYGICIHKNEVAATDKYFYVGAWKTMADFKSGELCTGHSNKDCGYLLKIKSDILSYGINIYNPVTAEKYSTQGNWWNPKITRVEDGVLFFRFIWATTTTDRKFRGKGMVNLPAAAKLSDESD